MNELNKQHSLLAFLTVLALLLTPATPGFAQQDDGAATPPIAADEPPAPREGVAPTIVGGQEATPGEYPWQVYVEVGDDDIGYYMCGGSLIAPQWVLTAAHCVDLDLAEAATIVQPSQVMVALGKHNIAINEPTQQIRSVTRVIAHPSYNPVNNDNDLALLELTTPVNLNDRVATIPLLHSPTDDALTAPGILAIVTGWGATVDSHASWSPTLQEVAVPIVSNATCNSALPGPSITDNQICAGFAAGGKDSCYGDSGGPLIVPNGGGWKQTGIVSYGYGCAKPNLYGVYTRVSRYITWIGQYVNPLSVTSFSPTSGRPGTQVTITGAGLSSVTAVDFAGTVASFTASSDTQIVAAVPEGAVSGLITLRSADADVQTTSSFQPLYQLDVQTPGNGVVDVMPGSVRCTSVAPCSLPRIGGQTATLIPTADVGFVFAGWRGGACPTLDDPCTAYINADRSEIAVFAPPTSTLTVAVMGNGSGGVVSSSGIDCGADCTEELPTRTAHTLTAQLDAGMIFTGWQGGCSGLATTCTVYMVGDQMVEAGFEVAQYLHLPIVRR